MPVNAARFETGKRPGFFSRRGLGGGSNGSINVHSSSSMIGLPISSVSVIPMPEVNSSPRKLTGPRGLFETVSYDYMGDAYSYRTGLSTDQPNFTKSYIAGVFCGLAYPFSIADKAIEGMSRAGKIAATGFNATVAGTAAFGASGVAHQDGPGIAGSFGAAATAMGSTAKLLFPGTLGNFLNQMIQGAAGPLQSAVTQGGERKVTMSYETQSQARRKLLKRAVIAYSGAVGIVAVAVVISLANGAGWRPALAGMPLYVTVFGGITYQLFKEWRALKRERPPNPE
ncbi:hypothetical protein [Burkholderia mayonis]|uniref:hypothetical protein n=1 Tax=Burkholderia mayonis TaxID=1385591 RepID=UPI001CF7EB68|nr:hypothetical protein [Burkholderia mayonis]